MVRRKYLMTPGALFVAFLWLLIIESAQGFIATRQPMSTLIHQLYASTPKQQDTSEEEAAPNDLARTIDFDLHTSILDIPAESWDACLVDNASASPFMQHAWLRCLEESKCAAPDTGWVPQHVSISVDGTVQGYVPMYIKAHSMGEFIFDNAWADAAYRSGINYYPKLLVGIPFTPATGQRILLNPRMYEELKEKDIVRLRRHVGMFLKQVAASNKLSSVHLNFLTDAEATDLAGELPLPKERGDRDEANDQNGSIQSRVKSMLDQIGFKDNNDFLRRTSLQYHWVNENANNDGEPYQSFDDYLGCFKSKRRINIRRERSKVMEDEQIRVDAIAGEDILKYDGLVERMFEIYVSTVDKMFWGRQYLTLEFFQLLTKSDFVKNLCFMCARHRSTGDELHAKDVFAGTFNIIKDGVFYGRYWGCLPGKEVKNLHFEACYWSAIDYCIQKGLNRMEPGAGGGDYKWARGFDPALIHSAHYICNPGLRRAVGQFLDYETENNVEVTEYLLSRSAVGSTKTRKER